MNATAAIARWVLSHKRLVIGFWVLLTVVGGATVGHTVNSLSKTFSVPGREGYVTNQRIMHTFGGGGRGAPLLAVIALPAGTTVASPGVRTGLDRVAVRLARAVPGSRIASYATTSSHAFVSADGRTTFVLGYPPPTLASFGANTAAAKTASAALQSQRVAGARVYVTGVDALQSQTGGAGGPSVFLESVLGGFGALIVLAFVFASLLAFVPLVMAIVSIMTTFLVVWGSHAP